MSWKTAPFPSPIAIMPPSSSVTLIAVGGRWLNNDMVAAMVAKTATSTRVPPTRSATNPPIGRARLPARTQAPVRSPAATRPTPY